MTVEVTGPTQARTPRAAVRATRNRRARVRLTQAGIVAVALLGWQFLPQISALQDVSKAFDPYFVSSPALVAHKLGDLFTGADGSPLIWSYVFPTVLASLLGTVIGMVLGALCGLVLSNFAFASETLRPFIIAINATPRVALVPIIVIVFGPTLGSSVIVSVLVVFFVAFFNAYEGGTSVREELVQNARLLGAGDWKVLTTIRLPFVMAWTLAGLPLAVTFAVITVVTAEILTGYPGLGSLLLQASTTADSSLTFAVVLVLAVVGVVIVVAADAVRNRILHWWGK